MAWLLIPVLIQTYIKRDQADQNYMKNVKFIKDRSESRFNIQTRQLQLLTSLTTMKRILFTETIEKCAVQLRLHLPKALTCENENSFEWRECKMKISPKEFPA